MRVLIVDDSRAMRMIVQRGMRQAGMKGIEVTDASNGLEAIAQMHRQLPELILCDWNMPEMDGITLLRKVRELGYKGRFGFVTSAATNENKTTAREAGADFIIGKPFTPERLSEAMLDGEVSTVACGPRGRDVKSITDMLCGLLNREIMARRPKVEKRLGPRDMRAVAIYTDAKGTPSGVVLADFALAFGAAGALSMMSQDTIDRALKGHVTTEMANNLQEVFNVFSRVLDMNDRQVKLQRVVFGTVDRPTAQLIRSCQEQSVMEVEVSGYGGGLLCLYAGPRV